jgi:hypothetical protein
MFVWRKNRMESVLDGAVKYNESHTPQQAQLDPIVKVGRERASVNAKTRH